MDLAEWMNSPTVASYQWEIWRGDLFLLGEWSGGERRQIPTDIKHAYTLYLRPLREGLRVISLDIQPGITPIVRHIVSQSYGIFGDTTRNIRVETLLFGREFLGGASELAVALPNGEILEVAHTAHAMNVHGNFRERHLASVA
jgi:hypothetical protein